MWRVLKLGGSVLTEENSKTLAKILEENIEPSIYVVSALKGVTDTLESFVSKRRNNSEIKVFCEDFFNRHRRFLRRFSILRIPRSLTETIDSLKDALHTCSRKRTNEEIAKVMSFGEKASAVLVNSILNAHGIHSRVLSPREAKLKVVESDDDLFNAKLDVEYCASELKIEKGVFVVPGFFSVDSKGRTVLLGRNGSDYTAAALAFALNTKSLELYKDVSGFMSCDPKMVANSFTVQHLTYEEAEELAFFGAKILHPLAIAPLKRKRIKIEIYDINSSLRRPSTEISNFSLKEKDVGAMALTKVSLLNLRTSKPSDLLRALTKNSINVQSVLAMPTSLKIIVNGSEEEKCLRFLKSENLDFEIERELSFITLTGKVDFEGFLKLSSVLTMNGIKVKYVSFSCGFSTHIAVENKNAENAARIIHAELFEKNWRFENEKNF